MKYLLLLLFVFFCFSNKPLLASDSLPFFTFNNKINWTKFEKKVSDKDRRDYALKIKNQFDFFFEQARYLPDKYDINNFEQNLHFIDLNGDGKLDIIYEGFSGTESDFTEMLINKDNGFIKVVYFNQYLETLEFDKSGKLNSYTTLDFGCCAAFTGYETKYLVNDKFETSILSQRAMTSYTKEPKTLFSKPIKFSTINDSYTLRSAPLKDDSSTIIYCAMDKGNVIAIYPKNSIGKAWAETDTTGRIWWFVEMEPVKKLSYNLIFYQDSIPAKILGWMSSRYLKKLE
jgi:hypothetical protein